MSNVIAVILNSGLKLTRVSSKLVTVNTIIKKSKTRKGSSFTGAIAVKLFQKEKFPKTVINKEINSVIFQIG